MVTCVLELRVVMCCVAVLCLDLLSLVCLGGLGLCCGLFLGVGCWVLILFWVLIYLMFGLRFAFRCLLVSVFTLCICVDVLIVWLIVLFCLNCI